MNTKNSLPSMSGVQGKLTKARTYGKLAVAIGFSLFTGSIAHAKLGGFETSDNYNTAGFGYGIYTYDSGRNISNPWVAAPSSGQSYWQLLANASGPNQASIADFTAVYALNDSPHAPQGVAFLDFHGTDKDAYLTYDLQTEDLGVAPSTTGSSIVNFSYQLCVTAEGSENNNQIYAAMGFGNKATSISSPFSFGIAFKDSNAGATYSAEIQYLTSSGWQPLYKPSSSTIVKASTTAWDTFHGSVNLATQTYTAYFYSAVDHLDYLIASNAPLPNAMTTFEQYRLRYYDVETVGIIDSSTQAGKIYVDNFVFSVAGGGAPCTQGTYDTLINGRRYGYVPTSQVNNYPTSTHEPGLTIISPCAAKGVLVGTSVTQQYPQQTPGVFTGTTYQASCVQSASYNLPTSDGTGRPFYDINAGIANSGFNAFSMPNSNEASFFACWVSNYNSGGYQWQMTVNFNAATPVDSLYWESFKFNGVGVPSGFTVWLDGNVIATNVSASTSGTVPTYSGNLDYGYYCVPIGQTLNGSHTFTVTIDPQGGGKDGPPLANYGFGDFAVLGCCDSGGGGSYPGCVDGKAIVSCFSGLGGSTQVSNPSGYVFGLMDIRDPLGNGAPAAPSNWAAPSTSAYHHSSWTASVMGEVFGVDFGGGTAPAVDVYVASEGVMPAGFSGGTIMTGAGGTGGDIYKISGTTGAATLFASLPNHTFSATTPKGVAINAYVGLGQVSWNGDNSVVYASNMDDGKIYVVNSSGTTIGTYDHGASLGSPILDNTSNLWTQKDRAVFAVEYNAVDHRLYYGLQNTAGQNEIWSVTVSATGTINSGSKVLEYQDTTNLANTVPSDIQFDGNGSVMLISEMTVNLYAGSSMISSTPSGITGTQTAWYRSAHESAVYKLTKSGTWGSRLNYSVGTYGVLKNSSGGSDFGKNNYGANPDPTGVCEDAVVMMGDALELNFGTGIYGLQISDIAGNATGFPANSYYVDIDGVTTNGSNDKTLLGDVDICRAPCTTPSTYTGCVDGKAIVSCFSGLGSSTQVSNPSGYVFGLMDIRDPLGNGAPAAPSNWAAPSASAYHHSSWTASVMGEVFGVDFGGGTAPAVDVYVSAVGTLPRAFNGGTVITGAGGSGGDIYKINGATGVATLFASLPNHKFSGTISGNATDAFVGLGQVSWNGTASVVYASNYDDGLIYVLNSSGATIGTYDHGATLSPAIMDVTTDLWTSPSRAVYGLEYNAVNNKLYYATRNASNKNVIWSVTLNTNGTIVSGSKTQEYLDTTSGNGQFITDIEFDSEGSEMLVSEMTFLTGNSLTVTSSIPSGITGTQIYWDRGAHLSKTYKLTNTGTWGSRLDYSVGLGVSQKNSAGGADFGMNNYGANPDPAGVCEDAVVIMSDFLVNNTYGLQISNISGNVSGFAGNSYFVDLDGVTANGDDKSLLGDVDVCRAPCIESKYQTFAAWQAGHASYLSTLNLPLDNKDGDSWSNLIEYAFCTPVDNGTKNPICFVKNLTGGWDVTFHRTLGGLTDVTYCLLVRESLVGTTSSMPSAGWTEYVLPNTPLTVQVTPNADGVSETVTIKDVQGLTLTGDPDCLFVTMAAKLECNSGVAGYEVIDYTDVQGYCKTPVEMNECETFSCPFITKPVFTGTIDNVGTLSLDFSTTSGAGVDFTPGNGVLEAGKCYYLEVIKSTTGANLEGNRLIISTGATGSVTIVNDTNIYGGPPWSTMDTSAGLDPDLSGDLVAIYPCLTLDEFAPKTQLNATTSSTTADRVLIPTGTGSWDQYWLFSNSGNPIWVKSGAGTTDQGSTMIPPCSGAFLHPKAGAEEMICYGTVRDNDTVCPIAAKPSVNFMSPPYPYDMSPTQMNLLSPIATGTRSSRLSDQILTWNRDGTSPTDTDGYCGYWYINHAPYTFWTKIGTTTITNENASPIFKNGRAAFVKLQTADPDHLIAQPWISLDPVTNGGCP